MRIPRQVEDIIGRLRANGYGAYAVGGCVRDMLMGREPEDWDITTSARPEQVKVLFRRTIDTGIQHGTVTVMIGRTGYEVTTYRIDGAYEDGRHPKQVAFTSDLREDLRRRDFTINAMAYSPESGIIDAFDGIGDLKRRVIRCVGDPMERFSEDALRILRAIRFSAQLGFTVEEKTRAGISVIAPNIAKVSKERIQAELTKLLISGHPERMREVYETGISAYVSPAFAQIPYQGLDIPASLPALKYVRWSAFLRLADARQAADVLRSLKLDNATIRRVQTLVSWSGRDLEKEARGLCGGSGKEDEDRALAYLVRRAMGQMAPEVWDALADLNRYSPRIRALAAEIRKRGDCLDLKQLAVNGQDLLDAGAAQGREVGGLLKRMLDEVLMEPERNTKEYLLGKYFEVARGHETD